MSLASVVASRDAVIPDIWLQGRTAYGGLSAAIALSTAQSLAGDLPPLRSAQVAFVGPLGGRVAAHPVMLRRGRNSAFVSCDVTGESGLGLRALFLFMDERPSSIEHEDLAAPPVAEPGALPLALHPMSPGFLANFDLAEAEPDQRDGFLRWARLRKREALDPYVELIVIADALPPAALALAKTPGPVSTTTWQLNLIGEPPTTRDGWWLLEARTLAAQGGVSTQAMTIWNRDGRPVASAVQSVALFM